MQRPIATLFTEDPKRYPNYKMPLWHNPQEDFSPELGFGSRLRMILVEDGSGVLRVGGWRGTFIAPVLLCISETERPELEEHRGLRAQAVFFHPSVVNGSFDFEVIRGQRKTLSVSESQDLTWFTPFTRRPPDSFKPVPLGPASARRISELMKTVGDNLAARADGGWPCRSRSFFLELLIVAERACANPPANDGSSLAESPPGVDSVIMYLHAHYHRRITLSELSRVFHTNRTTLTEQFNRATGLSVVSYLTRLRMSVAASILRDTELNIGEIMQRVGFRDITHFGRTFRRFNGCTPSEYRRKYCWMLHS